MSARYITQVGEAEATVEILARDEARVRVRIEDADGARELSFAFAQQADDGRVAVIAEDGRVTTATTRRTGTHDVDVTLGFDVHAVRVIDERDAWMGAGDAAGGSGDVSVAMPGRVVKIVAAVGQEVAQGEPVMIIEAMKMENELKAPRAGVVSAINVAEGDSVEADRVLMTID